jgi:hypothetical protein
MKILASRLNRPYNKTYKYGLLKGYNSMRRINGAVIYVALIGALAGVLGTISVQWVGDKLTIQKNKKPSLEILADDATLEDVARGTRVFQKFGGHDAVVVSISDLYKDGYISHEAYSAVQSMTGCNNLHGIEIEMASIEKFKLSIDAALCNEAEDLKQLKARLSEDGQSLSVAISK